MKLEYDKESDTLTIVLRDVRIKESDEVRPGVIADFGYDEGIVSFEILDASKVLESDHETLREVILEGIHPASPAVREKPDKPYGQ
jgi:uncharacterized protein YuzE